MRRKGCGCDPMKPILVLLRRWLSANDENRKEKRVQCRRLFLHYSTGGGAIEEEIDNISLSGFFVKTKNRIYVGTVLNIVLQKRGASGVEAWIMAQARVVRHDSQGTGFEFVLLDRRNRGEEMRFAGRETLRKFLQSL